MSCRPPPRGARGHVEGGDRGPPALGTAGAPTPLPCCVRVVLQGSEVTGGQGHPVEDAASGLQEGDGGRLGVQAQVGEATG